MRNYAWRRTQRSVKAMRRLHEDRAEHSGSSGLGGRFECSCFKPDGRVFARFADYPACCSCNGCRNPRHVDHSNLEDRLTRQERRAPGVDEWEAAA